MPRKTKANGSPPPTDESPTNLTKEQEERALLLFHFDKLRQQEAKAREVKAKYDAEREVLTDMFRVAKADGFTRKELQALLDDTASLRRDLTKEEERRAKLRAWVGLPVGTQLDLFALPLEAQDEQDAQGQGYAAGLRGEPGTAPDHIQPRFIQAYLRGWGKGQEELSWALSEAGRIVDRRKDANPLPVQLEPEPEESPAAKASRELGDRIKAEEAAEGQGTGDPSRPSSEGSQGADADGAARRMAEAGMADAA